MTWWQALILGITEGLTEYLPVSSTGHLILTAWLLGFAESQSQWEAVFTFNIVIQAGAIAAVLGLYWSRVKQVSMGLIGRDLIGRRLALSLGVGITPALVLGPILHDRIRDHLNGPWPVVGALFVGAWLMLVVSYSRWIHHMKRSGHHLEGITWLMAFLIGCGQCVAMWPGTSRSMMTIVTGLLVGLRLKAAAEFSFLLGLVTLLGATGYEFLQDGTQMLDQFGFPALLIGFAASTISAALAVKWFVAFITRRGLGPFGWYRLIIAVLFSLLLWGGVIGLPRTP